MSADQNHSFSVSSHYVPLHVNLSLGLGFKSTCFSFDHARIHRSDSYCSLSHKILCDGVGVSFETFNIRSTCLSITPASSYDSLFTCYIQPFDLYFAVHPRDLTPGIPAEDYERRRRTLMDSLPDNSIVVCVAAPIKYMSASA